MSVRVALRVGICLLAAHNSVAINSKGLGGIIHRALILQIYHFGTSTEVVVIFGVTLPRDSN